MLQYAIYFFGTPRIYLHARIRKAIITLLYIYVYRKRNYTLHLVNEAMLQKSTKAAF